MRCMLLVFAVNALGLFEKKIKSVEILQAMEWKRLEAS